MLCLSIYVNMVGASLAVGPADGRELLRRMKDSRSTLMPLRYDVRHEYRTINSEQPGFVTNGLTKGLVNMDDSSERMETIGSQYRGANDDTEALELLHNFHHVWDSNRTIWYAQPATPGTGRYAAGTVGATTPGSYRNAAGYHGQSLLEGKYWDNRPVYDLLLEQEDVRLREDTESVDGFDCYVVEGDGDHGYITLWIDVEYGYNARKATLHKDAEDLGWSETPIGELLGSPMSSFDLVLDNVVIERIDGRHVPIKNRIQKKETSLDGSRITETTVTTELSGFQFNPDFEVLGAFRMDMPNGTVVYDKEESNIKSQWQDGQLVPLVDEEELDALEDTIAVLAELEEDSTKPIRIERITPDKTGSIVSQASPSLLLTSLVVIGTVLVVGLAVALAAGRKRQGK